MESAKRGADTTNLITFSVEVVLVVGGHLLVYNNNIFMIVHGAIAINKALSILDKPNKNHRIEGVMLVSLEKKAPPKQMPKKKESTSKRRNRRSQRNQPHATGEVHHAQILYMEHTSCCSCSIVLCTQCLS